MNKEDYLHKVRSRSGSDHTISNYKTSLNHFQKFLDQYNLEVSDLNTDNIHQLYTYFDDSDLSGSTIDQYLQPIKKYIREEVSEEIAEQIKEFSFDTQSVTEQAFDTQTPILSVDQYKKLVDAAPDTRSKLIIQILWETGIRPSELSKLKVSDLNTDDQTITVHTSKIPQDSGRPRTRTIPYSIELKSVLREWIEYGKREKYKTSSRSDFLIVTENSTQIQSNYINTIVRKTADKAGILREYSTSNSGRNQYYPNARHFRNSYATHRSWNGMDLETLRQLLGHHSVEVTSRYVQADKTKQSQKNEQYRPKTYTDAKREVGRKL